MESPCTCMLEMVTPAAMDTTRWRSSRHCLSSVSTGFTAIPGTKHIAPRTTTRWFFLLARLQLERTSQRT